MLDEDGVTKKFSVAPKSIPDYLALVGDTANDYPGLSGWGAKSAAAVFAKYPHLESIPKDWREWRVDAPSASALASTLFSEYQRALLFRRLATLRTDVALFDHVEQLRWKGSTPAFAAVAARLDGAKTEKKERGKAASLQRIALALRNAAFIVTRCAKAVINGDDQ